MKTLILLGFLLSQLAMAEAVTCSKGTNVWGENIRTGKALGPSLAIARELAYSRFLSNLSSVGRDCFEKEGGQLQFGPVESFSDETNDQEHWATIVVNIGCCVLSVPR